MFNTAYNRERPSGLDFPEDDINSVSATQQHFKDEVDLNSMIKKYGLENVTMTDQQGFYGDFTNVPSYQEMKNQVIACENAFMTLSADVRAFFNNDPEELISFMSDPANKEKALELGLLTHIEPSASPLAETIAPIEEAVKPAETT